MKVDNYQEEVRQPALDTLPPPIERVHISSLRPEEFVEHYQRKGIPVIIKGLLDREPDWNLHYLCQHIGNQEFPIRYYGRERYKQDKRQWTSSGSGVEARTLLFSEYAEMLRSGEAYEQDAYLARCSLQDTSLADASTLRRAEAWLRLRLPATSLNLWVGSGGHTSCLHYDPMDGVLMQLHGAKKILLFPPPQTYNLYPIPVLKQLRYGLQLRAVYSQVYPEHPNFNAFPKFRQALPHCQEGILNRGEILFIPAGWWHEVTALGNGIVCSVNRFWNVFPVSRAMCSWNKWRAHLGGVLAAPHIGWNFLTALTSSNHHRELSKLVQRL
jgi:lysine-specific demethylase 8/hypoxia-inducible factor 1-alpha inhibitor (HIF hydroxylase)